jgi:hypothetical protein
VSCSGNKANVISPTPDKTVVLEISGSMEIDAGKEIGDLIVKALEAYYNENGKYPDTLQELVPKYLDEVPTTSTGQEYKYYLKEPTAYNTADLFGLGFPLITKINTGCSYFKSLLRLGPDPWECGPSVVVP